MKSPSCTACGVTITRARLEANPAAKQCVACLTAVGDVPLIRRYDDINRETSFQTYFTHNLQLETASTRSLTAVPSEAAFFVAAGDDADYVKPPSCYDTASIPDEDITQVAELLTENFVAFNKKGRQTWHGQIPVN